MESRNTKDGGLECQSDKEIRLQVLKWYQCRE
jgi:hypothetical protein